MDEINEVKKAIRHENWKQMYEEYLNSGMTAKSWCEAQGIQWLLRLTNSLFR